LVGAFPVTQQYRQSQRFAYLPVVGCGGGGQAAEVELFTIWPVGNEPGQGEIKRLPSLSSSIAFP
jgi:hypothetical protein